jgi:hypothetical protein
MKLLSTFVLGLLAALLAHGGASAATVGNCEPNAVKYSFDSTKRQTISDTLTNLPGSTVNFTTAEDGCVLVTISAILQGQDGDYTFKPVLDGDSDKNSFPGLVRYNFPATRSISAVFIFHNVSAGAHQLRMQWSTEGTLATANSLVSVQYIK